MRGYILTGAIAIIVILLAILYYMENKINKKLTIDKNNRNLFYLDKILKINKPNSKKTLEEIDTIAKNFFKEAFKQEVFEGYTKFKESLNKEKNKKEIKFCETMTKALYSKKEPEREQIKQLIVLLINLVKSNRILTPKEKKELEEPKNKIKNYLKKKKEKIQSYLQKIKIFGVDKKKSYNKKNNSKNSQISGKIN